MSVKTRILVVEDDPFISLDLTQALSGFGYEVVAAVDTGESAVTQALALEPNLILMDISLKGQMDGVEAAETIHRSKPLPVIFLSASSDERTLQRAKLTGPYGYLIKPYEMAELRFAIEVSVERASLDGVQRESRTEDEDLVVGLSAEGREDRIQILRKVDFFSKLPLSAIEALAKISVIQSHEAGEFLIVEGDEPETAFVVLSGRISVTKAAPSGKELILALLGPGDTLGLLYSVKSIGGMASACAQLESKTLSFSCTSFTKLCRELPDLQEIMNQEIARRLVDSYQLAMSLAHSRVETRILNTLVALISTLGRTVASGSGDVRLFITRKELADLTGTTPETAIRITKQLERDGILELSRPGIIKIPDIAKLKATALDSAAV